MTDETAGCFFITASVMFFGARFCWVRTLAILQNP
jgi:hypothetical protein